MKRFLALAFVLITLLSGCQSSPAAPEAATIAIAITNEGVSPNGASVEVRQGGTVTITVTSTKAAEVHVHGYEVELQVAAGATITKSFTADQPGSFEVETHDPDTLVAQLVVRG